MTTPTAKAIPSNSPNDLLFNAERIDKVVNDTGLTFLDRFGNEHKTLAGLREQFPNAEPAAEIATAKADIATSKAEDATMQAGIAMVKAGESAISATASAISADQATAAARAKISIAAANADGAIANGQSFTAPLADGSLQAYVKDGTGAPPSIGAPFISRGYLDSLVLVKKNDRSGYVWTLEDLNNTVWIGLRTAGRIDIGPVLDVIPNLQQLVTLVSLMPVAANVANILQPASSRTGMLWWVETADNKVPIRVDTTGNFWIKDVNLSSIFASSTIAAAIQQAFNPAYDFNIVMWGDSKTEMGGVGSVPYQLGLMLPTGISVSNKGYGGQSPIQVSMRANGVPTLLTFTGGTIPADTSAVAVTAADVNPLTGDNTPSRTCAGWIYVTETERIYGNLVRGAGGSGLTFARAVAGTAVTAQDDMLFVFDNQGLSERTFIIDTGTNGPKDTPEAIKASLDATQRAIDARESKNDHYLVPLVTYDVGAEIGTANRGYVRNYNKEVKRRWPHNFVDFQGPLAAAANLSLPQDVIDLSNGIVVNSLRSDGVHNNDAGRLVRATVLYNRIVTEGWLP